MNEKNVVKRRRQRETPIKKWDYKETALILDYILEHGNLEKPTAQTYYKKLLAETKIETTWNLVRWKMRNLKLSFIKATELQKSTDAGLETEDGFGSVQAKINKMCPYYDRLQQIFGDKSAGRSIFTTYELPNFVDESEESTISNIEWKYSPPEILHEVSPSAPEAINDNSTETKPIIEQLTTQASCAPDAGTSKESLSYADLLLRCSPNTASNQLAILQAERHTYYESKLELEKEKFIQEVEVEERKMNLEKEKMEKEFEIQDRKLKFEEEKLKWEQELRKQELELKKLQMEKEERIAIYEIDMKYKNK